MKKTSKKANGLFKERFPVMKSDASLKRAIVSRLMILLQM